MALDGVLNQLRGGWAGVEVRSRAIDSIFWLCVLAGITPALTSNLISPIEWIVVVTNWPPVFPRVDDTLRVAALVLLIGGGAIAIAHQRYWHLLMLLPLALYAFSNNDTSSGLYVWSQAAYGVASFAILIGFVLSGGSRLRSLYFVGYLAVLTAISLVEPIIWGYQIVVFLGFVVVARIIALFIRENVDTFREMGLARVARVAGVALLMWLPILIFILPSQLAISALRGMAEDYIYSIEPLSNLGKQRDAEGNLPQPRELRSDINASLEIVAQIKQVELDAGLAQLGVITEETRTTVPAAGREVARQALPGDPLLQLPSCNFPNILACIERAIKGGINRGYSGIRDRALDSMRAELQQMADDRARTAQEVIEAAKQRVIGTVQGVKTALQMAALYAFMTFDSVNLVLNLLLVLAAIKSYTYVFARFAFRPAEKGVVTLATDETPPGRGVATFKGQDYTIRASNRANWYYSTRFDVEGRPGKFAVPQWRAAVLARLLSWNYAMNIARFDRTDENAKGAVKFKVSGETNFVEWQFLGGEEVVFHFDDFVAMSEGVTLSSIVSFRISTLLLGRYIFHVAKGPGTLLLRVRGEPTITGNGGQSLNRPARLHVAWNRGSEFDVHAERDVINIYVRGVNLSSRPSDVVIVEAGTGDARALGGIARFIKSFLLPV